MANNLKPQSNAFYFKGNELTPEDLATAYQAETGSWSPHLSNPEPTLHGGTPIPTNYLAEGALPALNTVFSPQFQEYLASPKYGQHPGRPVRRDTAFENIVANMTPIYGDYLAIDEGMDDIEEGNYGRGAFNIATAIPGIGDVMTAAKIAAPAVGSAAWLTKQMMKRSGKVPPTPFSRQQGILGGALAKNADLGALKQAKKMRKAGASREEIWAETGWFRGKDKKWRFEIDDSLARLDEEGISWGGMMDMKRGESDIEALGDIMKHDEAARAYDDIFDFGPESGTRATARITPNMKGGSYADDQLHFGIEKDPFNDDLSFSPENRSTALHELQHAIQQREGFARGGSPEMFAGPLKAKKEAAEAQISMINDQMRSNVQIRDALDAKKYAPGEDTQSILARMKEYEDDYQNLIDQKMAVLDDAQIDMIEDPYQQYRALAGEAEARAVQARMDLTPEQRAARPFWEDYDVPESEQVVRYGDGSNMADDYRGAHTAPVREEGIRNTLDDVSDIMPDDFYDPTVSWNYYGHGGDSVGMDRETASIVARFKGNPNANVTIYRAVPVIQSNSDKIAELEGMKAAYLRRGRLPAAAKEQGFTDGSEWYDHLYDEVERLKQLPDEAVTQPGINSGDWVTVNKHYAQEHGKRHLGKYKIIQKKVKARDIATDGNSIHEWGYDPQSPKIDDLLPMDEASRMARAKEMGFDQDVYHASKQDFTEYVPGYDDGLVFTTPDAEFANQWLGKGKYRHRIGDEAITEVEAARKADRALRESFFDYNKLDEIEAKFGVGDEWSKAYDEMRANYMKARDLDPDKLHNTIYPMKARAKKTFHPEENFDDMKGYFEKNNISPADQEYYKQGNYLFYERKDIIDHLKDKGYDSIMLRESSDGTPYTTLALFEPNQVRSRFAKFDPLKASSPDLLATGLIGGLGLNALMRNRDDEEPYNRLTINDL